MWGGNLAGDGMADGAAAPDNNSPVTLHRIMQTMIAEGLNARYQPPQKLSHELFVLLMQLQENERRGKARKATAKPQRTTAEAAVLR